MKILAPGTPKYLLIDTEDVARNKERRKLGTPVACVVEIREDEKRGRVLEVHRGYDVRAESAILTYSQNDPLFRIRLAAGQDDTDFYAAYSTDGEVRIAETHGEDLTGEVATQPTTEKATKKK